MADLVAEAATAQDIGRRTRQEDAVIAQFRPTGEPGLAVLSDGMGGHDDGDLAGRILASEMFGELFLSSAREPLIRSSAPTILGAALASANRRLQRHIEAGHIGTETGGTLVSVMVSDNALRWISVGDSPLFLWRGGDLRRLNEDHSMAPQIDMMAARGEIGADDARDHADRHCLTSAVTGGMIPRVDCPEEALPLKAGDVVILASDGLDVLGETRIAEITTRIRRRGCQALATALLDAVRRANVPEQDNTSLVVICVKAASVPFGARVGAAINALGARSFGVGALLAGTSPWRSGS